MVNMCHGRCDGFPANPARANCRRVIRRLGLGGIDTTRPHPTESVAGCKRCTMTYLGLPPDHYRCPCCNGHLRCYRRAGGALAGRGIRAARRTAIASVDLVRRRDERRRRAIENAPPRYCLRCGKQLALLAPYNAKYCSLKCNRRDYNDRRRGRSHPPPAAKPAEPAA